MERLITMAWRAHDAKQVLSRVFSWTDTVRGAPPVSFVSKLVVLSCEIGSDDMAGDDDLEQGFESFGDALPVLIGRLRAEQVLTLSVRGVDTNYFSSMSLIDSVLAPSGWRFVLMSRVGSINPAIPQQDVGNLFFECPISSFTSLPYREWLYRAPFMDIEGYVTERTILPQLSAWHFQPDTWERADRILGDILLSFRIWTDGDGMTIVALRSNAERAALLSSGT